MSHGEQSPRISVLMDIVNEDVQSLFMKKLSGNHTLSTIVFGNHIIMMRMYFGKHQTGCAYLCFDGHSLFMMVTRLIHVFAMTHSYVCHDSFVCAR